VLTHVWTVSKRRSSSASKKGRDAHRLVLDGGRRFTTRALVDEALCLPMAILGPSSLRVPVSALRFAADSLWLCLRRHESITAAHSAVGLHDKPFAGIERHGHDYHGQSSGLLSLFLLVTLQYFSRLALDNRAQSHTRVARPMAQRGQRPS
jgi:hypothetical protein